MRCETCVGLLLVVVFTTNGFAKHVRHLSVDEYVDKMKAGWVGQMVGVGWGGPTEFRVKGKIMPAEQDAPVAAARWSTSFSRTTSTSR